MAFDLVVIDYSIDQIWLQGIFARKLNYMLGVVVVINKVIKEESVLPNLRHVAAPRCFNRFHINLAFIGICQRIRQS